MLVAILFGHSKDYDMKAPSKKACFGYNKFRRTEILYFFRKFMFENDLICKNDLDL